MSKVRVKSLRHLGFNGYYVSTGGDLFSIKRGGWQKLKPFPVNKYGHLAVDLCLGKRGIRKVETVHRLVLLAFVGSCPEGMECCHDDGNPQNNDLSNLRWDTPKSNNADKVRHGTHRQGESINFAKLKIEDVIKIRNMHATGRYTYSGIARVFGVSWSCVRMIVLRENWKHVESLAAQPVLSGWPEVTG